MKIVKYTAAAAAGAVAAVLFLYFALAVMLVEAVQHTGSGEAAVMAAAAEDGRERVYITADDGVVLAAICMRQPQPSAKWAVIMHGYTSCKENMLFYAGKYYEKGWSVLIPDQRAHGESGGEYCALGWAERLDAIKWAEYIASETPEAEIVMHGVSMGASSLLMAAGEGFPENVTAVVSDCAFTDVMSIMEHQISTRLGSAAAMLRFGGSIVSQLRCGSGWNEASALAGVSESRVPIMFVHGGGDEFVPVSMAQELYAAAACSRAILVIPGADHALSAYEDTEKYWTEVLNFVENNSSMHKNG